MAATTTGDSASGNGSAPAPTSLHPNLAEACRAGSLESALGWAQRLAPSPRDPDNAAAAQNGEKPFAWFIDATDGDGRTAFHWAVAQRSFDLAQTLAQEPYGCDVATRDSNGTTTLLTAIMAQAPTPLVELILERGIAKHGAYRAAAEWVNATERSSGNAALHAAASRNQRDVAVRLLAAGADPLLRATATGQTALHKTIARNAVELAEDLIEHCRKEDPKTARRLVNAQDNNGDTALHHASAENNKEFGEVLLRHHADRAIRNKAGHEFWQVQ